MIERYRDQAMLFGRNKVGIVTQPLPLREGSHLAVVILNSGVVHRVGHNRMYVTLSRILAGAGHTVVRFDASGIGDSGDQEGFGSPLESGIADLREVLDTLERGRGIRRFVLMGLCAGADQSVVYAGSDPRVVGTVLLDPSIPTTVWYRIIDMSRGLLHLQTYLKFLRGESRSLQALRRRIGPDEPADPEAVQITLNDPAVRGFLEDAYSRAVSAGVQLLAIFTSGMRHQHNHRRQMLGAFARVNFRRQLRLEFFRRCDHLFTAEAERDRLFRTVRDWLDTAKFATPPKDAAPTEGFLHGVPLPEVISHGVELRP